MSQCFIRWGLITLLSPLAADIVWFSRGSGWIAAFCAALPIGLLVSEGYNFIYSMLCLKLYILVKIIL